jgi:hypothetical protein
MKFRITDNPSRRGDVYRGPDGRWRVYPSGRIIEVPTPDPADKPIGLPGRDGRDGVDGVGRDGRDGQGFQFAGPWRRKGRYSVNDVVYHKGGSWVALIPEPKNEPTEQSKQWGRMSAPGDDGIDGKTIEYYTRVVKRVADNGAANDIELAFLEDAPAGTALYLENNDQCGVTNSLSRWRLLTAIGFAVNDTIAGSRGLVRVAGIVEVPQTTCLKAGWNYFLSGYGGVGGGGPIAVAVNMGVSIDERRLLIRPQVLYHTRDELTANLDAGTKGQVVTLVGPDTLMLADRAVNWQACGVLTADVSDGTANYVGNGQVTQSDWSAVVGTTELTPNTNYYGSHTPGLLTSDSDDGNRLFIGRAKSATTLRVDIGGDGIDHGLAV